MQTNDKKILMIAMPVTLTVMLAVLLALVLMLANAKAKGADIPAGGSPDTTPAPSVDTTLGNIIPLPDDTNSPIENPVIYSRGLSFVSYGNGTCYVSGMGTCTDIFVTVPPMNDDGEIVVAIGSNAFKGAGNLTGIELPASLRSIGSYAFYGSALRSIEIPESVTSIGDYAFCNCRYLAAIGVETGNRTYSSTDGVLFNKDRTVLISYPAGLESQSYSLPSRVSEIKTMAFYNCNRLTSLFYSGTASQYAKIIVGAGNDALDDVRVTFTTQSGK